MPGSKKGPPALFWDIAIADQWNTTPWDVRENMSYWDYTRLLKWNKAKSMGMKVAKNKAEADAKAKSKRRR